MKNDHIHIYPLQEEWAHCLEGIRCECNPKIEIVNGQPLIIHNAFSEFAPLEPTQIAEPHAV